MKPETDKLRDEISSLAERLISIPSVSSDHNQCLRAIELVENLFSDSNYKLTRYEHKGVYSLIISRQEGLSFDICFLGHLDVVPAPENCFSPSIKDGWIFGRGASDMKGECAAMIRLFLDNDNNPEFSRHALILTTDEEVGGENGIGHLIHNLGLSVATVFNPDGGGEFAVCAGQKGILQIRLTARGKSAHASRPWQGSNAIELLMEDIRTILNRFNKATGDDQWQPSANLGVIKGGEGTNSVAAEASATIDIRFPGPAQCGEILDSITSGLRHSTIEPLVTGEPVYVSETNECVQKVLLILQSLGLEQKTERNCAASDARWFAGKTDNIVLMLPRGTNGHIDEEAVEIEGLATLYSIMEQLANSQKQPKFNQGDRK